MRNVFSVDLLIVCVSLLVVLILAAHVIWLAERRSNPEFPADYWPGIWEALWWAAVTATTVGYGDKTPKGVGGRLFGLLWMFVGLFVLAYFTAGIASAFAIEELEGNIGGAADLRGSGSGWCRTRSDRSSSATWVCPQPSFQQANDAYDELLAGSLDAVVHDAASLQHFVTGNAEGGARLTGPVFSERGFGFALGPDSALAEPINLGTDQRDRVRPLRRAARPLVRAGRVADTTAGRVPYGCITRNRSATVASSVSSRRNGSSKAAGDPVRHQTSGALAALRSRRRPKGDHVGWGANRFVAGALATALVVGSCGSDDEAASTDEFAGVSMTVGSKNFTEQYVLSEILIQALEARGADVVDATDTGDTPTTRAALLNGEIDGYFEYNSTGWVEHLGKTDPDSDGETLTEDVREADEANGIRWLGRSTFNDTYGFAIAPEIANEKPGQSGQQRHRVRPRSHGGVHGRESRHHPVRGPEFTERSDGLVLFETATGYDVPDDRVEVFDDAGAIYEAVAEGDCHFGEIFTTDGRIGALDLDLVIDPGVFYVYNVSLNIRDEVYQQAPDAFDQLVDDVIGPLTQARITELNQRVSDGQPVEEVAADYLDSFDLNP